DAHVQSFAREISLSRDEERTGAGSALDADTDPFGISGAGADRTDSNAKRDHGSGQPGVRPCAACCHDHLSNRAIETGGRLTAAALHLYTSANDYRIC